jgi:hypothetical protein
MAGPGKGVMVHVEGTRSLDCRTPVEKMSGAFLDMAMQVGAPVVPVRFVGGLPAERLHKRLEFPVGMGKQDIWLGKPILPETLASMPYKERKELVVAAINGLGPSNAVEEPFPPDAAFELAVRKWQTAHKVSPEDAVLHEVLAAVPDPTPETRALLATGKKRRAKALDPRHEAWLEELGTRLGTR